MMTVNVWMVRKCLSPDLRKQAGQLVFIAQLEGIRSSERCCSNRTPDGQTLQTHPLMSPFKEDEI